MQLEVLFVNKRLASMFLPFQFCEDKFADSFTIVASLERCFAPFLAPLWDTDVFCWNSEQDLVKAKYN